jgi:multidrug efflux pump
VPAGNDFQLTVSTQGRLLDEQQFGEIIVRQGAQGQVIHVHDVARVELAARDYSVSSQLSGKPAAALVIWQLPGSNAIQTSDAVRAKLAELKQNFPPGVDFRVIYDTTVFARESITAVVHTLFEAVLLVVIVVIVFLQTWRASIIPMIAVPVSLVGTFAVMSYSFSNRESRCTLAPAFPPHHRALFGEGPGATVSRGLGDRR